MLVAFSDAAELVAEVARCGLRSPRLILGDCCEHNVQAAVRCRSLSGPASISAPLAKCVSAEQLVWDTETADRFHEAGSNYTHWKYQKDAVTDYDGAFGTASAAEGCAVFHFPNMPHVREYASRLGLAGQQCLVHALDDFLQKGCAFSGCCAEGLCTCC